MEKNQNNAVDPDYIYNFTVETFLFEFIRGLKYSFETWVKITRGERIPHMETSDFWVEWLVEIAPGYKS